MDDATKTRQLVAELTILDEYDRTRSRQGHDFGCGQRGAELGRRRHELAHRLGIHVGDFSLAASVREASPAELISAWKRVGEPRQRRARNESYRFDTPSTSRTLRAWAMVEKWLATLDRRTSFTLPPSSTREVIERTASLSRPWEEPPRSNDETIARMIDPAWTPAAGYSHAANLIGRTT